MSCPSNTSTAGSPVAAAQQMSTRSSARGSRSASGWAVNCVPVRASDARCSSHDPIARLGLRARPRPTASSTSVRRGSPSAACPLRRYCSAARRRSSTASCSADAAARRYASAASAPRPSLLSASPSSASRAERSAGGSSVPSRSRACLARSAARRNAKACEASWDACRRYVSAAPVLPHRAK